MATSQRHLDQWTHNRALLPCIPGGYPDWIVTIAFYVSLQAIDALLAFDNVGGITSHDRRNHVLSRTNRYSKIWRLYTPLYDLARTVRYLADPSAWVPEGELDKNVIRRYMMPIERSVESLMKTDLKIAPPSLQVTAPPLRRDDPTS